MLYWKCSERRSSDPLSLVLAGDARDSMNYGMIATGNHQYSNSLRGAPLVRNDIWFSILLYKNRTIPSWYPIVSRIQAGWRTHCPPGLPGHALSETTRRRYRAYTQWSDDFRPAGARIARRGSRPLIIYLRFLPISLLLFGAKWGILY